MKPGMMRLLLVWGLLILLGGTEFAASYLPLERSWRPLIMVPGALMVLVVAVGFMEVKVPGKGADPRRFQNQHDKDQWQKLRLLPNLLYTDGNSFSLWRDGKPEGAIVHLEGNVETAGAKLAGTHDATAARK